MGLRGELILVGAVIVLILGIFTGNPTDIWQGFGVLFIFGLIFVVSKLLN